MLKCCQGRATRAHFCDAAHPSSPRAAERHAPRAAAQHGKLATWYEYIGCQLATWRIKSLGSHETPTAHADSALCAGPGCANATPWSPRLTRHGTARWLRTRQPTRLRSSSGGATRRISPAARPSACTHGRSTRSRECCRPLHEAPRVKMARLRMTARTDGDAPLTPSSANAAPAPAHARLAAATLVLELQKSSRRVAPDRERHAWRRSHLWRNFCSVWNFHVHAIPAGVQFGLW